MEENGREENEDDEKIAYIHIKHAYEMRRRK